MKTTLSRVAEFHEAFLQDDPETVETFPTTELEQTELGVVAGQMREIADKCHALAKASPGCKAFIRLQLIQEELSELAQSFATTDIVESLDALTDLQYVIDGTYLALGMNDKLKEAAFDEVHRSNMSKLGEDGKPILNEAGRVQKGPRYFKPNLADVLTFHKIETE